MICATGFSGHNGLTSHPLHRSTDTSDAQWRANLQRRFAQIATERRTTSQRLADLGRGKADRDNGNPALLELLPHQSIDVTSIGEEDQRQLYDAFHLQVRYDRATEQVKLRVTVYAHTVGDLTTKIKDLEQTVEGQHNSTNADGRVPAVAVPRPRVPMLSVPPAGPVQHGNAANCVDSAQFVVVEDSWPLPPRQTR